MIRTILKPLSFIPALLLMYMIFSFSGQTGDVSSQLSYKVSYKIVETADYIFDGNLEYWQIDEWANKINFITRKLAHMTEYLALAMAVSLPLYVYGMHGILLMLVAGIICVGFACGDEYHQSFVMGRSPSVKDVCIDSVGVFIGIILVRIIGWTGRKTIFKQRKPKIKKIRGRKKKFKDESYYRDDYPPYQQPPYRGDPYRSNPYGNNPYRGDSSPNVPYDERRYRTAPPENDPYWQAPPENDHYTPPYPGNQYEDEYYDDPIEEDFPPVPPSAESSKKSRKKKKEKDWFFDV